MSVHSHLAEVQAQVSVEQLARYLAWSDRAMGATASSTRFVKGSEAYWAQCDPNHRARWIGLAAALLGVTDAREMVHGRRAPGHQAAGDTP